MLVFGVYRNGKRVKTLKAVNMDTVFRNYAKYANSKGFIHTSYSTDSFGNTAWDNAVGERLTLRTEN